MMELFQEFRFDAAHHFADMPAGHRYAGIHGHSFTARITVAGTADPNTGFLVDLGCMERACAALREQLDHRYLNQIEGLMLPSLENIATWIWRKLEPRFPQLARVEVRRDGSGHGCVYHGPQPPRSAPEGG